MNNEYTKKLVTADEAVAKSVKDGDWVEYGFSTGYPELLDKALANRVGKVKDVKIRGGLIIRDQIDAIEADVNQESFSYYSWHIGDYERKLQSRGLVHFMPSILRLLPDLYRNYVKTDVAFIPVSKPDENGYCSLGFANYTWKIIADNARTVIFEINEHYPVLIGNDECNNKIHISKADYIVEGVHSGLPIRTYKDPSPIDLKIAENVMKEIPDGACLGLGVGGVPFAVANMIKESSLKDLGCWTGTLSDPFMELYEAGKLSCKNKVIDKGLITWNLASGSQKFYDWIKDNPKIFQPGDIDYVHNVERMSKNPNFISINGGVQVDLMGQENAESLGTRQLSGIGGQLDFLEAAFRSQGGKGFICMNSARKTKEGELKSNIVPFIPAQSTVSAPRTMIQCVATEYGVAKLSGKTLKERAEEMIKIAHPDFREELSKYAYENFK